MIYGDNPQKINEREDKLGLKTYSYAPQISAVVQSGNLYVYAVGNPVMYADEDGEMAKLVKAAIHGAINGIIAAMTSDAENTTDYVIDIATAFGSGFVSDYVGAFETFLISSVIELSIGMFRKEITFDNFNDALFNTLSSGLIMELANGLNQYFQFLQILIMIFHLIFIVTLTQIRLNY